MMTPIIILSLDHLAEVVEQHLQMYGPICDLNHLDISRVPSLEGIFYKSEFNGDISRWDTSNVCSLKNTFEGSKFNGDISNWNTSKVQSMEGCFSQSAFNGDISNWDTSNVTDMGTMFYQSQFTGDISRWDTSKVRSMDRMFEHSPFDGYISEWDVHQVINMTYMFKNCPFRGNISRWDVANLEYAYGVFTSFQDNLLGYLGVLQNEYALPEDFTRAAQFHQVRALAEGLGLDPMGAARFIAREMHQPELVVNLPTSLDFSA